MSNAFNSFLLNFQVCSQIISVKRRPEMDTNGFYGDTFSSGFGDFYTAKRADKALEGWPSQFVKVEQSFMLI